MINARLGTAKEAAGIPAGAGRPDPAAPSSVRPRRHRRRAPKPRPKAESEPKRSKRRPTGVGDQVKDVAVDFAKDMLTTADGRRTLRSVFGTLFGKK